MWPKADLLKDRHREWPCVSLSTYYVPGLFWALGMQQ